MTRRAVACWGALVAVIVLIALLAVVPVPYAVLGPGPVCNTTGDGVAGFCPATPAATGPLITVSPASAEYATTTSHLGFTTVSTDNDEPSVLHVLQAWLSSSEAVVPRETIFPPMTTRQQSKQVDVEQMQQAQDSAVTAAEAQLGLIDTRITAVAAGSPAAGKLQVGDVLTAVDGRKVASSEQLVSLLSSTDPGRSYALTVRRAGGTQTIPLMRARNAAGQLAFGISLEDASTVKVAVTLDAQVIGGPSAGLMFTLGIYDRLTPGSLTGPAVVAGTGTIDALGNVGAIGGIQQKLVAARQGRAFPKAAFFLAPADNCADTKNAVPAGLRVVKVSTLAGALTALADIRSGDLAALPRC